MNSTTYRRRTPSPIHPAQILRKQASDTKNPKHPARDEIAKCLGTHSITAVVEEDMQTLTALNRVEGLVAFLVTLTKNGRPIAQGRGSAVLNPMNRFISRTVASAFNSALADAAIRATRVLDTFRDKSVGDAVEDAYREQTSQPATDKQKAWLRELIILNVEDDTERQERINVLDDLSKDEASQQIQTLSR